MATQCEPDKESGMLVVTTSPSSGYMTVSNNLSVDGSWYMWGHVPVPVGNTAMTTFKALKPRLHAVWLYRYFTQYDKTTSHFKEEQREIWSRRFDTESDFVHVVNAPKISLKVERKSCLQTHCFISFFSFFPKSKAPQRLSSGSWNCSGSQYSSFYVHVDCNLKPECEDGRDETGHCPFSSPDCQGLVALCSHCYSLDTHHFGATEEHCSSLGGRLSFPKCVHDWGNAVTYTRVMHPDRLRNLWFGVHMNDVSLPAMYRHVAVLGRTVFHHAFPVDTPHEGSKTCLTSGGWRGWYKSKDCQYGVLGSVCEFTPNNTGDNQLHMTPISLKNVQCAFCLGHDYTVCHNGLVIYTFLLCGSRQYKECSHEHRSCHFPDHVSYVSGADSANHNTIPIPMFTCSNEAISLSYTLVCNYVNDCQDSSDESFCHHPICVNKFTCNNGNCLPFQNVCDQVSQCQDGSEENNCEHYRIFRVKSQSLPSPVQVAFDGIRIFTSSPMYSNESCPDSHYRCPGDVNDCLPVYTRCNGMHDCIDRMDEDGCGELACPGFFRCRHSTTCIHSDHMCDGWPHCPMHDDEIVCDTSCPVGCQCQGHTFLCSQPFYVARFPYIRCLDATSSGLTLSDVRGPTYLIHLVLARCSLTLLPGTVMLNMRFLDLSENILKHVNMSMFLGLINLQVLSLSNNPLFSLYANHDSVVQQRLLTLVDLSFTTLTMFDTRVLSSFPCIHKLNLTFTAIHTINSSGFRFTPQLTELYMDGSPVLKFPPDLFKALSYLNIITSQNYKLCCKEILPAHFDLSFCHAPNDEISSCEDLLQSPTYRGFLWLITCLSVTGNVFCLCARLFARSMISVSGFSVFVTNLTLADFLMGVYIAIIGVADERFRGRYLHHGDTWKSSVACKVAGFLSLLSSEVSALVIWLITLDRFLVLRFPFSTLRFERPSASAVCLLTWCVGWCLATLPLLPMTSHWEFYSQTGICIPLPVTRRGFKGRVYSFGVLIVFNFILFLLISAGQIFIYWSVQSNALKDNTTKVSRDITIAQRLITVAVTDFMCWFPIGLCGMLALAGTPIPGEVNVALAIFVLPLNSAINPFMYTFNTLAEKQRLSNEAKLLRWLESHAEVTAT